MDRGSDVSPSGERRNDEGRPAMGRFYVLRPDFDMAPHEVAFENAARLRPPSRLIIRPEEGGFPPFNEIPRLRETSPHHTLADYETAFEGYWLVSARLKRVFEAVDSDGFAFSPCEFFHFDGTKGAERYLCDVVRVLDAIDDEASDVKILREGVPKGKYYLLAGGARLAFKTNVVASAHVFRSPFNSHLVVVDRIMRDALVEQGFGALDNASGMCLDDASDY